MRVIIVGCGRLGVELATRLYHMNQDVTVVDSVALAFNNLPADFRGRTTEGDALSREVLHRAGIEKADALAAVTNQDPLNVVVAQIAREIFHVPNVVVRNYDPLARPLLEAFGFRVVSSTAWGAQRIEEILDPNEIHPVFSTDGGEVQVYEIVIPRAWDQKPLATLALPDAAAPIAISRNGKSSFPDPEMLMKTGDVIYFSATQEGVRSLQAYLLSLKEG